MLDKIGVTSIDCGKRIAIANMQLGDTVQFESCSGYGCCTVTTKTENYVELVRPYIHLADFSATGCIKNEHGSRVISYIGTETIRLWRGDTYGGYTLISRKALR